MKHFYYELSLEAEDRYWFVRSDRASDAMVAGGYLLTASADRIWLEEDGTVRYIKHRLRPIDYPVDLKEFMWVKLKSKPYER